MEARMLRWCLWCCGKGTLPDRAPITICGGRGGAASPSEQRSHDGMKSRLCMLRWFSVFGHHASRRARTRTRVLPS